MANTEVAVIGTGNISRRHMPGWAASEHADVVAAADLNIEVARAATRPTVNLAARLNRR